GRRRGVGGLYRRGHRNLQTARRAVFCPTRRRQIPIKTGLLRFLLHVLLGRADVLVDLLVVGFHLVGRQDLGERILAILQDLIRRRLELRLVAPRFLLGIRHLLVRVLHDGLELGRLLVRQLQDRLPLGQRFRGHLVGRLGTCSSRHRHRGVHRRGERDQEQRDQDQPNCFHRTPPSCVCAAVRTRFYLSDGIRRRPHPASGRSRRLIHNAQTFGTGGRAGASGRITRPGPPSMLVCAPPWSWPLPLGERPSP